MSDSAAHSEAVSEMMSIRSDITKLEAALFAIKGVNQKTVMGRDILKFPTQEKLKQRSQAMRQLRHEEVLRAAGVRVSDKTLFDAVNAEKLNVVPPQAYFNEGSRRKHIRFTPVPVGRGEALILGQAIKDLLPQGLITASCSGGMALGLANTESTAVQGHVEREAIKKHWELIDMVMQEVSRQVASNCIDRARVLEQVRQRYTEMFDVFLKGCYHAQDTQLSLQQTIVQLEELVEKRKQQFEGLQLDHNKLEVRLQTAQEDLVLAANEKKELHQSTKEVIGQLQNDRQLLEREVLYYEMRLQEMEKEREKHINDAVGKLEDDLVTAIEERDDLRERIRFMEKQLHKARDDRRRRKNFVTANTQTEKTGCSGTREVDVLSDGDGFESRARSRLSTLGSEVFGTGNGSDGSSISTPGSSKTRRAKGKSRRLKKRKDLGGFALMIAVSKSGRTKGRQWVLKNIAQIYVDRIHANTVDDREQAFRSEICDYVLDWHLNRYGLRNLAEINLLDLAASVRSHAKHSIKIRIFGTFCGLVEEGLVVCELDAVNFYLVCLQHLAHPFGVMALFPENSEDGACSLKNAQAVTALKTIFREMDDPDGARIFIPQKLEPIQASDGSVDVDALTLLLLDEWAIRRDQNTTDLTALFTGGDRDEDGSLAFDEFVDVMRHVLPTSSSREEDRTMTSCFREALNIQKSGNTIQVPAFLAVARKHGLAYWHLKYQELVFIPGTEDWASPVDSKKRLTDDAIFEGVHRMMGLAVPCLQDQIEETKQNAGEWASALHLDEQYAHLMNLLHEKKSAAAAYAAFEMLLEQIKISKSRRIHKDDD